MQIIDSHQHFWHYDEYKHEWITEEMKSIRKDFLPKDLASVYRENHVNGCVAVQADQTEAETMFLIDLASKNDFIKGIVGWVDLRAEHIESRLEYFKTYEKLKGFRHILQGEVPEFMLQPSFLNGLSKLAQFDFTYDLLVFPHQLNAAYEMAKQFPNLKFNLCHLAKPYIKDQKIAGWKQDIKTIAALQNVYCKLSGLVTEANYTSWKYEDIVPYLDVALEAFGTERLMFGSDWPVCLVAAEYTQVLGIVSQYFSSFSQEEQSSIFANNCLSFYNL